ncbi:MAG TPA: exodeoxyribonuclease VII small subunit [Solirubrobacteraceae bacterium]|jgi:exodeoxyribonuclease VII small subunit|nr:exodeoxyribonuclease VII small subunit [Solirubrobacteraceae bacterium]
MSEATQSQAIMFEPTDEQELRAGRGEAPGQPPRPGEAPPAREQITFEQGYEELKLIVSRLDDPELPVHEMFEGFRRGKGLEKALRAYLQEREGELTELEEGNNLPEFEIASPSNGRGAIAS